MFTSHDLTSHDMSFSAKHLSSLKRILDASETPTTTPPTPNKRPLIAQSGESRSRALGRRARDRLSSSHFRAVNEYLYSNPSTLSQHYLSRHLFNQYHDVFDRIVRRWPQKPITHVISRLRSRFGRKPVVIADIGCGRRPQLKTALPKQTVLSFDLWSESDDIIAADMASLPLPDSHCDCAVFSLSLMATNVGQVLREANRVLATNACLLIVDVSSRFEDIQLFVSQMKTDFGFALIHHQFLNKDNFFVSFEFTKKSSCGQQTLPDIRLKPCVYKKR